ncbi:MAG: hypothetical protein LBR49_07930 [Tannerella sp.]|jgi:hypothetical protein|nr:hypothetical protein [Tannerella sp.]
MKHLVIFLTIICTLPQAVEAQFDIRSLFSDNNQQFIKNAVSKSIFTVQRSYQLQNIKSGERFGLNNAKQFGESATLGVRTSNGFILSDKAVRPWKYDPNYEGYRGDSAYEPVISISRYVFPNDSITSELPFKDLIIKPFKDSLYYSVTDTVFQNKGFTVDETAGDKKGWLVWMLESDSSDIVVSRSELTFKVEKQDYEVKAPQTDKEIVGGVFIIPSSEGAGRIDFLLCGIVSLQNGQWVLNRLIDPTGNSSKLTPITDDPSAKKAELTPIKDENDPVPAKKDKKKEKKEKKKK